MSSHMQISCNNTLLQYSAGANEKREIQVYLQGIIKPFIHKRIYSYNVIIYLTTYVIMSAVCKQA